MRMLPVWAGRLCLALAALAGHPGLENSDPELGGALGQGTVQRPPAQKWPQKPGKGGPLQGESQAKDKAMDTPHV